jgi:hypothetical protein
MGSSPSPLRHQLPDSMLRLLHLGRFGLRAIVALFLLLVGSFQIKFLPESVDNILSSYTSLSGAARSAWFSDAGFLRFNKTDGLKTTYEVWSMGAKGFSCDVEEERADGETVCVNTMRLTQSLYDHSAAQHRVQQPRADLEKEEAFLRQSHADLSWLRGKRILLLGDSNDRGAMDDLGEALPTSERLAILPETGEYLPLIPDWTTRFFNIRIAGTPSSIPTSNYSMSDPLHPDDFRIDFIFTKGIYDLGGEGFLDRIALLDNVLSDDIKYDLIIVNSGMWDNAKMEELYPGMDLAIGLPSHIVSEYIPMYVEYIERLRKRYGASVPFAMRPTHTVHPGMTEDVHNPLRREQLRQAQFEIARRSSLTVLPFPKLMQHQVDYYLDGYHPDTAANMLHMETVLRLVAEV